MAKAKKIIMIIVSIIILITLITLIIIKLNMGTQDEIIIQFNNEEINFSKTDEELKKELEMLDSKKLTIKNLSESKVLINNQELKPQETIELENVEINKDNNIEVKVKFSNNIKYTIYAVPTQPENFPKYESEGESKYDGEYYLVHNYVAKNQGYLLKLDKKGKIVFYKRIDGLIYKFQKIENSQSTRYTYLKTAQMGINLKLCDLIVLDENYNEIDQIDFKLPDGTTAGTDFHDSLFISDGNCILVTYRDQEVDNIPEELGLGKNLKVQNCMIQEIKDGKVLWQFQSIDYPELYKHYSEEGVVIENIDEEYFGNYIHFNSYTIDKSDGNLICSFRNLDEIVKINRKTGKIMWILGGKGDEFGLTEDQKFSKQHSVSILEDNTILIYDNGAKNNESRIIKMKIDEKEKKLIQFKEYPLDVFSVSTGSVQAIDEKENVYLVCYGNGDYRAKNNVEEINLETGEKYLTFEILYDTGIENILKIK